MRIESISIENFKVFKKTTIKDLPKMAVFLGPNGSGKSTFFEIFGFLSDCLQNNVNIAINRRGGFHELISRDTDLSEKIKFEIKFRNPLPNEERPPLVTYIIEIGYENGKAGGSSAPRSAGRGDTASTGCGPRFAKYPRRE